MIRRIRFKLADFLLYVSSIFQRLANRIEPEWTEKEGREWQEYISKAMDANTGDTFGIVLTKEDLL